jgi:hypothetical protein
MTTLSSLSLRRREFNPRPVRAVFVVDEVALEHVFLQVRLFDHVSMILPMLHAF